MITIQLVHRWGARRSSTLATHANNNVKGDLQQKLLSLERAVYLEEHTDMSLHACHQSKMSNEKICIQF